MLLPTEDVAEYQRHMQAYENELQPVNQRESDLVQSIAQTAWRLKRIPALEMAIFAQGRLEFGDSFEEHDPSLRPDMIELQTFIAYEKQLRNLQLQEARLFRRREKETAELRKLQQERRSKEAEQLEASKPAPSSAHQVQSDDLLPNGFEFSTPGNSPFRARSEGTGLQEHEPTKSQAA